MFFTRFNTHFLFISLQGVVAFSSQGDRIALTQIEQMVDGQYHKLGYYDTQADNLTWFNKEQWIGGKVSDIYLQFYFIHFLYFQYENPLSLKDFQFFRASLQLKFSFQISMLNLFHCFTSFVHCTVSTVP